MILLLQLVLAAVYAVTAHLASAWHDDRYALAALLALVAMLLAAPLGARRPWAWVALPLSVAGCAWLYLNGYAKVPLLVVPVVFVLAVAWVFARSLRPGGAALITRIVAALDGTTPTGLAPELHAYSRRLTAAWAGVLVLLALCNLVLAAIAVPGGLFDALGATPPVAITLEQWSWFANLFNYGLVGGFFVGEYLYRKRRFPGRYHNFLDFLRRMAGLGPAFWRDFLR